MAKRRRRKSHPFELRKRADRLFKLLNRGNDDWMKGNVFSDSPATPKPVKVQPPADSAPREINDFFEPVMVGLGMDEAQPEQQPKVDSSNVEEDRSLFDRREAPEPPKPKGPKTINVPQSGGDVVVINPQPQKLVASPAPARPARQPSPKTPSKESRKKQARDRKRDERNDFFASTKPSRPMPNKIFANGGKDLEDGMEDAMEPERGVDAMDFNFDQLQGDDHLRLQYENATSAALDFAETVTDTLENFANELAVLTLRVRMAEEEVNRVKGYR